MLTLHHVRDVLKDYFSLNKDSPELKLGLGG